MHTQLFTHANLATMNPSFVGPYGFIVDGAVAVCGANIVWCGPMDEIPEDYRHCEPFDLQGRLLTPALVDCHTHIIFGGNRADEFAMRLEGASYEEIARAGGGIASTVKATRNASDDELLAGALLRVDRFIAEGVADLEVKSGYGLTVNDELRLLRVAREISRQRPIDIHTSFLGAHAVPVEYKNRVDSYIDNVCLPALKAASEEGVVDAVDGFCENIAFSTEQMARIFRAAKALNIPVKLHAEQLSNSGGAALAAGFGALSADHLEHIDETGVRAMAQAGTVAVLLPGAFYYLRETEKPPVDLLRRHKVPMAVATDCNPGTSPLFSPLLAANMGAVLFGLTPEEAFAGITREAARALGLTQKGIIKAGNAADLTCWDSEHPRELIYHIGLNPLYKRIFRGNLC